MTHSPSPPLALWPMDAAGPVESSFGPSHKVLGKRLGVFHSAHRPYWFSF